MRDGFDYVGIDLDDDDEYLPISAARITRARDDYEREQAQPIRAALFDLDAA